MLTCAPLLFLLLTGCKKEEPQPAASGSASGPVVAGPNTNGCPSKIVLLGTVTDSLSGVPIGGLIVGPPFINDIYDTSGADGLFTQPILYNPCWHIPLMKPDNVALSLKSGQTHYAQTFINLVPYNDGDTVHCTLKALPYSQLHVHITGNGDHWSLKDFGPGGTALIPLDGTVDTIITRQIYSNRSIELKLYQNGQIHTSLPYTSQYGSSETIGIEL